jgi:hypothetical protein
MIYATVYFGEAYLINFIVGQKPFYYPKHSIL